VKASVSEEPKPPPEKSAPEPLPAVPPELHAVPLGPLLRLLMLELRAAAELLRHRDYARASVVIANVERSLDGLTPDLLLPTALSEFYAALIVHADTLGATLEWAASEDRRAQRWRRLYALSPLSFVQERGLNTTELSAEATTLELPATESAPLVRLAFSLRSASALLARGASERAAVMIIDLLPRLERFDAREYLVPLLYEYYQAQSESALEIERAGSALNSLKGQALRGLCRVDLAALLKVPL
jgi:hypothetical protein